MLLGQRICLFFSGLFGATSVVFAAAGSHAFKESLSVEAFVTFQKAIDYELYMALALLALVAVWQCFPKISWGLVSYSWILGTLLFSGSLLLHTILHLDWIVFLTPVGGMLMILGWFFVFLLALVGKAD